MPITNQQAIIAVLVMAAVTYLTRALPFLLFGNGKTPPKAILFLGKALPPAVIALLVVYCFKNVTVLVYPYGIPEAIAAVSVVLLHLWKKNTVVSVFGGTALYMLLLQFVFKT